jgi:arginine:ornithine antiporter/lysine permease
LATLYSGWLLYAAGLKYLLMVSALYLIGFFLYVRVQVVNKRKLISGWDWLVALLILVSGSVAVVMMATGKLAP